MALGADQALNIVVRLKDEASQQLTTLKDKLQGMERGMEPAVNASKNLAVAMAGATVAAGALAVGIGTKAVAAFNESQVAQAKLIQLHQKNTGATQEQTQSLLDLATQLQKTGVVGDDAIVTGQAQLATFKLSTDAISKLTPAMADMVAHQAGVNATGEDFVNIGNLVGKVMEGNVGALGRYGVSFTDAQQKMLEHGNETQRAATLAEVLAQNYGGVNEALRGTFEGQMAAANNTIGDFMELVGQAIVEYIGPLIQKFNEWAESMGGPQGMFDLLSQKIQEANKWINEHQILLTLVAGALVGALIPALISLATTIFTVTIPAFISAAVALAPFMLAGAVIAGIVAGAYWIYKNWDTVKEGLAKIWESIKATFVSVWNGIANAFKSVINGIIGVVEGWANAVVKAVNTIIGALNKIQVSVPDWVPKIGGKSFGVNIPTASNVSLPRFEHGGLVPGAVGEAVPAILHGGEQVIPASGVRGGNSYVFQVIINNPNVRSREEAHMLKEEIDRALRDVIRIHKLQSI